MQKRGKINVTFFLNNKVNPITYPLLGETKFLPLYVQVTYNRKNTQFRSFYRGIYSSIEQAYENDKEKLNYEETLIRKVVEFEVEHKKQDFQVKGIKDRYMEYTMDLDYYIDKYLRNSIYDALTKTGSKFWKILDPFSRESVPVNIYYEASLKLIENFISYLPRDFSHEVNWGLEFITWCKKKKNIPRLIDWLDQTSLRGYKSFLKKGKYTEKHIERKMSFINKVIKIMEGLEVS